MSNSDFLAAFKATYAELQEFYRIWLPKVGARCKGDSQRKAAFYAWSRFSMSIRTLEALLDPALLPDVYVICRGCLEFDVTLAAVMKDPAMAKEYMDFAEHARAKYLKLIAKQGDLERYLELRADFEEAYDSDIDQLNLRSWCEKRGGITGVMNLLNRPGDLRGYSMLCHFTHGSIWALETLDGKIDDPAAALTNAIKAFFTRYRNSTREFLWFIWGPLITPESERCKTDYTTVLENHIRHTD